MRSVRRLTPVLFLVALVFLARGFFDGGGSRGAADSVPATEVALEPLRVEMVRVFDGDSLIVRDREGRRLEVRLHAIDAPERRQPYTKVSRRNLERLLRSKELVVIPIARDRYERVVAKLMVDGRDAGLEQISAGLAWHYRRYQDEQSTADRIAYRKAERFAREQGNGLWKDPAPVPPWEHRQQRRGGGPEGE